LRGDLGWFQISTADEEKQSHTSDAPNFSTRMD
jgi:hypothetical protein